MEEHGGEAVMRGARDGSQLKAAERLSGMGASPEAKGSTLGRTVPFS